MTQIGPQDADGGTIDSKMGAYTKGKKPNAICEVTPGNTIPKAILEINHDRTRSRSWNRQNIQKGKEPI